MSKFVKLKHPTTEPNDVYFNVDHILVVRDSRVEGRGGGKCSRIEYRGLESSSAGTSVSREYNVVGTPAEVIAKIERDTYVE